jgi:hypothetical protein
MRSMADNKGKRDVKLARNRTVTLRFNQREKEAIDLYCQKYGITNKSKFIRETLLTVVLKRFDEDYPTLFEFEKPNLFSQG